MRVAIVGAAGYTGGELLRILLDHPQVSEIQAASESQAGKLIWSAHPNLRKRTDLTFVSYGSLHPADVVFLALPHGEAHPHPERLGDFVYGIPELHRERIRAARQLSGAGCNATAVILGVLPLARAGVIDRSRPIVAEAKVGSSEGGRESSEATHHPERSGAVRSFAPVGHRHTAEMEQELDHPRVDFSATSIEMVRGVLATSHVPLASELDEKALWRIYREAYAAEPFVRLVKERSGIYRYPEPKILAGSNYCDVGFALDPRGQRVVVISAIDNLVKGAAGNCVQAMNVACGFEETAGLGFPGLHP